MATTERTRQRAVHAERAKKKADQRRGQASGAAGWVADRAGQWSLDAQDLRFMELQKYFWNPLIDYWFRMDVEGWERLPEPPALLVGIHSGAPSSGTPGRSASTGGATSARSASCTAPP